MIDVDALADQIARRVAVISDPDALWSLETIALHCDYKLRKVREFAARRTFRGPCGWTAGIRGIAGRM